MIRSRSWLLGPLLLAWTSAAPAHPLGNVSTNRHATIRLAPETLTIDYVLDFAEVPAFRELRALDANGDGLRSADDEAAYLDTLSESVRRHLDVQIDGRPVVLAATHRALETTPGPAGVETVRVELRFVADGLPTGGRLAYRDRGFAERPGWQEVVAVGGDGTVIRTASVGAVDRSRQLRAYPDDLMDAPLRVHEADITFAPGTTAGSANATADGLAGVPLARKPGGATGRLP